MMISTKNISTCFYTFSFNKAKNLDYSDAFTMEGNKGQSIKMKILTVLVVYLQVKQYEIKHEFNVKK